MHFLYIRFLASESIKSRIITCHDASQLHLKRRTMGKANRIAVISIFLCLYKAKCTNANLYHLGEKGLTPSIDNTNLPNIIQPPTKHQTSQRWNYSKSDDKMFNDFDCAAKVCNIICTSISNAMCSYTCTCIKASMFSINTILPNNCKTPSRTCL